MLINRKQLIIEGAWLLKTNMKPWSPNIMVTSLIVWDAFSGLNCHSAVFENLLVSENGTK